MNRRNFILSSAMGAGALTVFPTSTLASNGPDVLSEITKSIKGTRNVSLNGLPSEFIEGYKELISVLNEKGYTYATNSLVQLNNTCYVLEIQKKSILGFKRKELALLVKEKRRASFYILEEELAREFNNLVENYTYNMKVNGRNCNVSEFAFPIKINEVKRGKISMFSYKNKLDNTIILKRKGRKSGAIIC